MSAAIDAVMASSAFSTFIGAFVGGIAAGCLLGWLADQFIRVIDTMTEESC